MNQKTSNSKPYVIYSKTLAGFALMQGCNLLRVVPNINNPLENVYIFQNTDHLLQIIDDYQLLNNMKCR